VDTRWNSLYNMLEMAITFKTPISQLLRDFNHGLLKEINISKRDWTQLTNLKDILYLFYNPTISLQGLDYPTLSFILPFLQTIYKSLLDFKQLYTDELNLGKEDGVSLEFHILYYINKIYNYR
jgi:hypothetical protein